MEAKGLLTRRRSTEDERSLIVTLTDVGRDLRDKALDVPAKMSRCVVLSREESQELYRLLYKLLKQNGSEA